MMTMHCTYFRQQPKIQTIADLAEIIWHRHFTPIIGKGTGVFMAEKFQSFNALKEQIENGYEYYRFSIRTDFAATAASIRKTEPSSPNFI